MYFGGDAETVEVVLRTIVSVNQLSVYGAAADMCMPTDLSTTNETPRTNETQQGNLLHDDKRKFANLPEHFQLIKLCSNAGIVKTAAAGQNFMTFDDAELEKLGGGEEARGKRGFMSRVHFTSRQLNGRHTCKPNGNGIDSLRT